MLSNEGARRSLPSFGSPGVLRWTQLLMMALRHYPAAPLWGVSSKGDVGFYDARADKRHMGKSSDNDQAYTNETKYRAYIYTASVFNVRRVET